MSKQTEFLRSGLFQHELTKTILGGAYGVKWAALLLVRSYWSIRSLMDGIEPPYAIEHDKRNAPRNYEEELRVVIADILWLHAELSRSSEILDRARAIATKRNYTNLTLPEPIFERVEPADVPSVRPQPARRCAAYLHALQLARDQSGINAAHGPTLDPQRRRSSEDTRYKDGGDDSDSWCVIITRRNQVQLCYKGTGTSAKRVGIKRSENKDDVDMEDVEPEESDGEMEWEDEDVDASAPIDTSPGKRSHESTRCSYTSAQGLRRGLNRGDLERRLLLGVRRLHANASEVSYRSLYTWSTSKYKI